MAAAAGGRILLQGAAVRGGFIESPAAERYPLGG